VTTSQDQLIKLYVIRAMKELDSLKGHNKEVTSLAWHPLQESVLASGSMDSTLLFWNLGPKGSDGPVTRIPHAQDMAIWDIQWHPAGHRVATGSNDRQTKLWVRNQLGSTQDLMQDVLGDKETEESRWYRDWTTWCDHYQYAKCVSIRFDECC
jgi:polyadenylation factor subunit 2